MICHLDFEDGIVFRYRARNFPETLTAGEVASWHEHVTRRIVHGHNGHRTITETLVTIDQKMPELTADDKEIAMALRSYLLQLVAKYGVAQDAAIPS